MKDRHLFGAIDQFRDLRSWARWQVFLKALFALPMQDDELAVYREHTGRERPPTTMPAEVFVAAGRRSGKTFVAALIAVYLACFRSYRQYLAKGERARVLCIATDRDQAGILLGYIRGYLTEIPLLNLLIESERAQAIDLTNGVTLQVATCSYRAVRGVTLAAAILDELAYWKVEGSNPDREVLTALRPGTATIPGAPVIGISSVYARSGVLYEALRDYHGRDGAPVLTWRAPTVAMNPTISAELIAHDRMRDPAAAAAEWDSEFREDLATFLSMEMIEAATANQPPERPALDGCRYVAGVDPSGGGPDAFTLAIAHAEHQGDPRRVPPRLVLDVMRGWVRDDVESVVAEIADVLRRYRIKHVTGDHYAGEWVPNAFRRHGIRYVQSQLGRSEIYLELQPMLATRRVQLLRNETMIRELHQLERRTGRQGRDSIDHPSGGHDDHANAAALALIAADTIPQRTVEEFRTMFRAGKPAEATT